MGKKGETMKEAHVGVDIRQFQNGARGIYLDNDLLVYSEQDPIICSFLKGLMRGVTAKESAIPKQKVCIDHNSDSLREIFFDRYSDEHTFMIFVFDMDRLSGESFVDKALAALGEVLIGLRTAKARKEIPISLFLHPGPLDWSDCKSTTIGIYVGCADDGYDGSNAEDLNNYLCKTESYVVGQCNTPEDDFPCVGIYEPETRKILLASQLAAAVNYCSI